MSLDDSVKESMSAVMDGEGTSIDVARVFRAVKADAAARGLLAAASGGEFGDENRAGTPGHRYQ